MALPLRIWLVYCLVCLALLAPLVVWRFRRAKLWICAAFCALLAAAVLVPWTPGERFMMRTESLKPGISIEQMKAVMNPYKACLRVSPGRDGRETVYTWYSVRLNWDYALNVTVKNGRVTHVEWLDVF